MQMFKNHVGVSFFILLLNSIIFISVTAIMSQSELKKKEGDYRLPTTIKPRHYEIKLIVSPELNKIELGTCTILIEVLEETLTISLHSMHLEIYEEETKLLSKMGVEIKVMEYIYDPKMNMLNICFIKTIPRGLYMLYLKYDTSNNYFGKKRSTSLFSTSFFEGFQEEYNVTWKIMLFATKFQSIEARQVFPCWDEPTVQATFNIIIFHRGEYRVFSNVPIQQIKIDDNHSFHWQQIFNQSFSFDKWIRAVHKNDSHPFLSTRDVMIAITNASYLHNPYTIYDIWSRSNSAKYLKFALNVSITICQFKLYQNISVSFINSYQNFLNLYQFVIPGIQKEVIGKWGLIIYKEELLIYDEEIDTIAHKMQVARTIACAMVRQLIDHPSIPRLWWSDEWLNEGLATHLHTDILNEIFPQWRLLDLFVVQVLHDSLHMNIELRMMPLTYDIKTPSDIESYFSSPFYIKGAVMLRTLLHIIGHTKFYEAVNTYLQRALQYKSTSAADLWAAIQNQNVSQLTYNITRTNYGTEGIIVKDIMVKDIMKVWVESSIYPVVEVVRINVETVQIKQYDYYVNGDVALYNKHNGFIPITFTIQPSMNFSNTQPNYWLIPGDSDEINVDLPEDAWIIVNLQQIGCYRVKYSDMNLELLANYLNSTKYKNIHVLNRAQIIDDAYHFWMANQLNYSMYKKLTEYLRQETDYVAWYPMFQVFRYISQFLPFEEVEPLQDDIKNILKPLLLKIYSNTSDLLENDLGTCLRQELVRWGQTFNVFLLPSSVLRNFKYSDSKNFNIQINKNGLLNEHWLRTWTSCTELVVSSKVNFEFEMLSKKNIPLIIFKYFSCCEISFNDNCDDFLYYLYHAALKRNLNKHHMYNQYIVTHAKNHIDNITANFEMYNVIVGDKSKVLCIIINHLYSEIEINKISKFVQHKLEANTSFVDTANIMYIIIKRLHHIKRQKDKLMKLLYYY